MRLTQQRGHPWQMEWVFEGFVKVSGQCHPHARGTFGWGKCHHCNRNLRSCQNTESWEGCKLSRNPIWNAVSLKWRSSLDDACVSNSINGDRKIGKPVWSFPYTRRETWENPLTTVAFFSLASLEKCMPWVLKKMLRNNSTKTGRYQFGFCPWRTVELQANSSLSSKSSINLGSLPNTSTYFLLTSRYLTTVFFVKSLGECCGSALACY